MNRRLLHSTESNRCSYAYMAPPRPDLHLPLEETSATLTHSLRTPTPLQKSTTSTINPTISNSSNASKINQKLSSFINMAAIMMIFLTLITFILLGYSCHSLEGLPGFSMLIRVDQSGEGDYVRIQDAIDAVASNNSEPVFVWVKPGVYEEKVVVPADKPFITLSGSRNGSAVVTWNESGPIFEIATISVLASDFTAQYLTIQNTYGRGGKAVALRVSGDRVGFYACQIMSNQDALLDDTGRHYYSNCYIQGDTDFICGSAASVFEKCHIHSVSEGGGAITAHHRMTPLENTGFTFLGCKITGVNTAVLGRPWGPYSRVVFALTYMSGVVLPQGWDDWGNSSRQSTAYYGEYMCYGPGSNETNRVVWSRNLTSEDAEPFLNKEMIHDGKQWFRDALTRMNRIRLPHL